MSSYIVVDLNVIDAEKLAQYSELAGPTVKAFDGKFIAKGAGESLHGEGPFAVKVIIEFPSLEKAREWYNSEEYQALITLRNQGMDSQFQLVAGL